MKSPKKFFHDAAKKRIVRFDTLRNTYIDILRGEISKFLFPSIKQLDVKDGRINAANVVQENMDIYHQFQEFLSKNKISPATKIIFFNFDDCVGINDTVQDVKFYRYKTNDKIREFEEWFRQNINVAFVELILWLSGVDSSCKIIVNSENNILNQLVLLVSKNKGISTNLVSDCLNHISFDNVFNFSEIGKEAIISDNIFVLKDSGHVIKYKNVYEVDKEEFIREVDVNILSMLGVETHELPDFFIVFSSPIYKSFNYSRKLNSQFIAKFISLLEAGQKTALFFCDNQSKIFESDDLDKINKSSSVVVCNNISKNALMNILHVFKKQAVIIVDDAGIIGKCQVSDTNVFFRKDGDILNLESRVVGLDDVFDKASIFDKENFFKIECINLNYNALYDKLEALPYSDLLNMADEFNFTNCVTEFGDKALATTHIYLRDLLGVNSLISFNPKTAQQYSFLGVDAFSQWGSKSTSTKTLLQNMADSCMRPVIIIEDGFIRSFDIGLKGEAGLSIIMDKKTSYYDATKSSTLEDLIKASRGLDEETLSYVRGVMDKIVSHRISKYNHAPILDIHIGNHDKKKILLVDQRFGDQSVASGLASEVSFDKMLSDVLKKYKDYDIIVKQHPDAITGGKSSYFSNQKMACTQYMDNVFLINFDINPYCLFDMVDEVFVGTSGMGFEALLAGKKVHCYGMPFYSGWHLTEDQIALDRRGVSRSLEEIFYYAYIVLSRYYSPNLARQCSIDEVIDYIAQRREW